MRGASKILSRDRGLGIGSAGLSLGVVSIKGEQEAFAGLCVVLSAVAATCFASIPAVSELLIKIAGGAPKVLEAATAV